MVFEGIISLHVLLLLVLSNYNRVSFLVNRDSPSGVTASGIQKPLVIICEIKNQQTEDTKHICQILLGE